MSVDIFPLNSDVVKKQYEEKNYKIIETGADSNRVLIFFSGNGLYAPNTEEAFIRTVVQKDRYEWFNVAKDEKILKYYAKLIFVRDIYRAWYVNGINAEINTIDKLAEFLKEQTCGYEVTMCGNSAGGYISMLCGALVGAKIIFNFSGQYSLPEYNDFKKSSVAVAEAVNPEKAKYYNISDIVEEGFYFYPSRCVHDIIQCEYVKDKKDIYSFPVVSKDHGHTVDFACYKYLFTMEKESLIKLHSLFKNKKEIRPGKINKALLPVKERAYFYFYRFIRNIGKDLKLPIFIKLKRLISKNI